MRALVSITKTARDFHDMPGRRDVSAATIAIRMGARCEGNEHPSDNKKRSHLQMPLRWRAGDQRAVRRIGLANPEMRARMAIGPPASLAAMMVAVMAMAPTGFGSGCEGDGRQDDRRKGEKRRNKFFHRWLSQTNKRERYHEPWAPNVPKCSAQPFSALEFHAMNGPVDFRIATDVFCLAKKETRGARADQQRR
jgi:hypothetical protein